MAKSTSATQNNTTKETGKENMKHVIVAVRMAEIENMFINIDHIVAIKPRYSPDISGTDVLTSGGHTLVFDNLSVAQVVDMIGKQMQADKPTP